MKQDSPESPPSDAAQPPGRSRNARAQARHRAKRKAYIEQLEETVNRLQAALASPDQTGGNAAPHARMLELERENSHLRNEIEIMKAHLALSPIEASRRASMPFSDHDVDCARSIDSRDVKRRRMSDELDSLFLGPNGAPAQNGRNHRPVPTLSLPTLPTSHAHTPTPTSATSPAFPNNPLFHFGSYPLQASSASSGSGSPYSASTFSPLPNSISSARHPGESFSDPSDAARSPQTSPVNGASALYPLSSHVKRQDSGLYLHSYADQSSSFFQSHGPPPLETDFPAFSRGYASSSSRGS